MFLGYNYITMDGDRLESKGVLKGGYINPSKNLYNKYLAYRLIFELCLVQKTMVHNLFFTRL